MAIDQLPHLLRYQVGFHFNPTKGQYRIRQTTKEAKGFEETCIELEQHEYEGN